MSVYTDSQTDRLYTYVDNFRNFNVKLQLYRVFQYLCHKLFLGIPHPKISKKVPINMGPKMNRFRDIQCCVEI